MAFVRQKASGDCGVASLACLIDATYEDVYVAVTRVPGDLTRRLRGRSGLYNRHLVAAAKLLGVTLAPTRRFDLDHDNGVLRVRWAQTAPTDHFVCVRNGLVLCPTYSEVVDWADYLRANRARPLTLLKLA